MPKFSNTQTLKSMVALIFACFGGQCLLKAQETVYSRPSWLFGAAAGGNFNFYRGSTQKLNNDFTAPAVFHAGKGVGLYLTPLMEFHPAGTKWGFMFQAGYDGRNGKFKEVLTPCNCPANLSTNLSYITIEPSVRFAPFSSDFYLFAGPRISFNTEKAFVYSLKTNPDYPEQPTTANVTGDLSDVNNMLVSMQIGAGYDMPLSKQTQRVQVIFSPFVSFQPYFGQSPRSIETWNITTVRVGAAMKFGRGHVIPETVNNTVTPKATSDYDVRFTVNSPKNIRAERNVREIFPLRNYVFFDLGSTEIPDRYVLLKKSQVPDFKEDQLESFKPKKLSGRSERQMIVYYNVLNILGDRMGKLPASKITLVGSSEKGPEDGLAMAESVKLYLVEVFAIDGGRITTQGQTKPRLPSEKVGGTEELELLREGDRRVSIETGSSDLLMEFQSGPTAPLKPVELVAQQTAPVESYVTFLADGATKGFNSWSLEIKDETGIIQYFGPYTRDKVSIPGKSILGTRPEGHYKATMVGKTKNGNTVRKETDVHLVLWTPPTNEEGTRYSVIFEFDESKSNSIYEKYLKEIVTPTIPVGATVVIHGHTDIIGDMAYNQKLSEARTADVRRILESSLAAVGRTDVKFEEYGFGEDEDLSPFENKYPEERFYNRTVIVDIIPMK